MFGSRKIYRVLPGGILAAVLLMLPGCRTPEGQGSANNENPQAGRVDLGLITIMEAPRAAAAGRLLGDKLLTALQQGNFAMVAGLPIGDKKNTLTQERFDKLCSKLKQQGNIASFVWLGDLKLGAYRRLLWKVEMNPQTSASSGQDGNSDVLFELVIAKLNNSYRVVGFGFRP